MILFSCGTILQNKNQKVLKYDDRGRIYNSNKKFLIFSVLHCFWRSQQLERIRRSFYHLGYPSCAWDFIIKSMPRQVLDWVTIRWFWVGQCNPNSPVWCSLESGKVYRSLLPAVWITLTKRKKRSLSSFLKTFLIRPHHFCFCCRGCKIGIFIL